jgi:hypothetical protein
VTNNRVMLALVICITLMKVTAAHAQRPDVIVDAIAMAFTQGQAKILVSLAARDGISIETREGQMGPLAPRQATAVLRALFGDRQTVSVRPGSTHVVGGSPARAFTEFTWVTRAPDTTQPERNTVVLELVREGNNWRITQIRLRP